MGNWFRRPCAQDPELSAAEAVGKASAKAATKAAFPLDTLPTVLLEIVFDYLIETETSIFARASDNYKAETEGRKPPQCPKSLPTSFRVWTEDLDRQLWIETFCCHPTVCCYPDNASLQQIITFLKSKGHRYVVCRGSIIILDCDEFHLVDDTEQPFYMCC